MKVSHLCSTLLTVLPKSENPDWPLSHSVCNRKHSVLVFWPAHFTPLRSCRLYIEEEIYAPENQAPPLGEGFALATIRSKARNYRRAGTDVGEILQASQRLAHAQSERQATACRLLPPVHWALLYTIGALFVSTFILFETGGSFSNEGRHILFTVLCGLMSFVLCVSHRNHSPTHLSVQRCCHFLQPPAHLFVC